MTRPLPTWKDIEDFYIKLLDTPRYQSYAAAMVNLLPALIERSDAAGWMPANNHSAVTLMKPGQPLRIHINHLGADEFHIYLGPFNDLTDMTYGHHGVFKLGNMDTILSEYFRLVDSLPIQRPGAAQRGVRAS